MFLCYSLDCEATACRALSLCGRMYSTSAARVSYTFRPASASSAPSSSSSSSSACLGAPHVAPMHTRPKENQSAVVSGPMARQRALWVCRCRVTPPSEPDETPRAAISRCPQQRSPQNSSACYGYRPEKQSTLLSCRINMRNNSYTGLHHTES